MTSIFTYSLAEETRAREYCSILSFPCEYHAFTFVTCATRKCSFLGETVSVSTALKACSWIVTCFSQDMDLHLSNFFCCSELDKTSAILGSSSARGDFRVWEGSAVKHAEQGGFALLHEKQLCDHSNTRYVQYKVVLTFETLVENVWFDHSRGSNFYKQYFPVVMCFILRKVILTFVHFE